MVKIRIEESLSYLSLIQLVKINISQFLKNDLKKKKILLLFILINLLGISNGSAQKKICHIKFNVKGDIKTLENKVNRLEQVKRLPGNSDFFCYQIGLEHDSNQKPIMSKPIYACCRT